MILIEAQRRHLEKVRERLINFSRHFKEIDLERKNFYVDISPIDEQIWSHLPDSPFWQNVESFIVKGNIYQTIYDELYAEVKGKGEAEIGSLDDFDSGGIHITSNFIIYVIELATLICLGEPDDFHRYEWVTSVEQTAQSFAWNFILEGMPCEKQHRELVQIYAKDERCSRLADSVKELRQLRTNILQRLNTSVENEEYIHYLCSQCHQ